MGDKDLLLTWFGQFMTEPRYPEQVVGEEMDEDELIEALEDGAILIRNPSARLAWSELGDDLMLFASGRSCPLPAKLRELLKLVCSADALHIDNLEQWLQDEDGLMLVQQLIKQGSLGFANE